MNSDVRVTGGQDKGGFMRSPNVISSEFDREHWNLQRYMYFRSPFVSLK
jgi:hypothetical protein